MYIDRVHLQNIKCFADIQLEFQTAEKTDDPQSNWNVILGDNGDGKTALLQAIAMCLMDAPTAQKFVNLDDWIRGSARTASLLAHLKPADQRFDTRRSGVLKSENGFVQNGFVMVGSGEELTLGGDTEYFSTGELLEGKPILTDFFADNANITSDIDFLKRNAFSHEEQRGWLSCGYGPFRRASGSASYTKFFDSLLQRRFLTLFEEGAALEDCEDWLVELKVSADRDYFAKKPRPNLDDASIQAQKLISKLLPNTKMYLMPFDQYQNEVLNNQSPTGRKRFGEYVVTFHYDKTLSDLSDGYRSMFALGVDIVRWLVEMRPSPDIPLDEMPGVVLIDEIDSHLHPKWQRQVGFLLTEAFPNIQFIVTTHSPLVAMAAGKGALTVLERYKHPYHGHYRWAVRANQAEHDLRRKTATDVLLELFELPSLRDPQTAGQLERYQALRLRHLKNELSAAEQAEYIRLEGMLDVLLAGSEDAPQQQKVSEALDFFTQALQQRRENDAQS